MNGRLDIIPGKGVALDLGSSGNVEFVLDHSDLVLDESGCELSVHMRRSQTKGEAVLKIVAIRTPAETQHHIVSWTDFEAVLKIEIEGVYNLGMIASHLGGVVVGLRRKVRCVFERVAPAGQEMSPVVTIESDISVLRLLPFTSRYAPLSMVTESAFDGLQSSGKPPFVAFQESIPSAPVG